MFISVKCRYQVPTLDLVHIFKDVLGRLPNIYYDLILQSDGEKIICTLTYLILDKLTFYNLTIQVHLYLCLTT